MSIKLSTKGWRPYYHDESWRDAGAFLRIKVLSVAQLEEVSNLNDDLARGTLKLGTYVRKAFGIVCDGWEGFVDEETDAALDFSPELVSLQWKQGAIKFALGEERQQDTEKN